MKQFRPAKSSEQWFVVIVTHSDSIKPLLEVVTGKLLEGRIPNCRVHHIRATANAADAMPSMRFLGMIENPAPASR